MMEIKVYIYTQRASSKEKKRTWWKVWKRQRKNLEIQFCVYFFFLSFLCMCTYKCPHRFLYIRKVSTLCFILIPIYILFPQKNKNFPFTSYCVHSRTRDICAFLILLFWWFYFNICWLFRRTRGYRNYFFIYFFFFLSIGREMCSTYITWCRSAEAVWGI